MSGSLVGSLESSPRGETTGTFEDASCAGEGVCLHRHDKTIALGVRIDVEPNSWQYVGIIHGLAYLPEQDSALMALQAALEGLAR